MEWDTTIMTISSTKKNGYEYSWLCLTYAVVAPKKLRWNQRSRAVQLLQLYVLLVFVSFKLFYSYFSLNKFTKLLRI